RQLVESVWDVMESDVRGLNDQVTIFDHFQHCFQVLAFAQSGRPLQCDGAGDEVEGGEVELQFAHADQHHFPTKLHCIDRLDRGFAKSGEVDDDVQVLAGQFADVLHDSGYATLFGFVPHFFARFD